MQFNCSCLCLHLFSSWSTFQLLWLTCWRISCWEIDVTFHLSCIVNYSELTELFSIFPNQVVIAMYWSVLGISIESHKPPTRVSFKYTRNVIYKNSERPSFFIFWKWDSTITNVLGVVCEVIYLAFDGGAFLGGFENDYWLLTDVHVARCRRKLGYIFGYECYFIWS